MFGIARAHFQQIAVVPGDMVDLEDLRRIGERACHTVFSRHLIALHGNECQKVESQHSRCDIRGITAKHSACLELAHALEYCGRRQTYRTSDVGLGFPGIGLKNIQYLKVYTVECSVCRHFERIIHVNASDGSDQCRLGRRSPRRVKAEALFPALILHPRAITGGAPLFVQRQRTSVEELTEEGIKAALRKLTENTRRIRLELLGQMRRPAGTPEEAPDGNRPAHYEIRGSEGLSSKPR